MSTLLEVRNLRVAFPIYGGLFSRRTGQVVAVDDVSFTLEAGQTLGLVGESGCGKTTVAKALINLLRFTTPGVELSGQVLWHTPQGPLDLLTLNARQMRPYRRQLQMVFQDPYSSLNPRLTVGQIVSAPLRVHSQQTAAEREQTVGQLLHRVGLHPRDAQRYPHEFSGGQRQRIGIARALALRPQLIIADEPVSALDVSVQAQVVNLLQDLQEEFGLAYLFVAHDLSVVYHVSQRIAVMYLGRLVELGDAEQVYHRPRHPYSRALLSAVPKPDPRRTRAGRVVLEGDLPTPLRRPSGCAFHTRCPVARPDCSVVVPQLLPLADGRLAACPFAEQDAAALPGAR